MAFDGTLKFDTSIDKSGFELGISGIGNLARSGMEAVTSAVQTAVGAMANLGAQALTAYADYEQLTGGVETLFGAQGMSIEEYAESVGKSVDAVRGEYDKLITAQTNVMNNAAAAFETAGLSQNEYMETVTSFSAALIASLEGDTVKAAEVADKAIIDMADNANKMGSSMESIQTAYQGFAKQNYTMLDNLKLGYGGTKTEMERLLADAQAISGIEYNIDSYADVVEAIHVIQDQMGITGTTSREASETISGSVAMTKSAFSNLMIGIADDSQDFDKLMNDLVTSATAAAGNILPRVQTIIGGLGTLIESGSGIIADFIVGLAEFIPDMIKAGVSMTDAIINGFLRNRGAFHDVVGNTVQILLDGILSAAPGMIKVVQLLIRDFLWAFRDSSGQLTDVIVELGMVLIEGVPLLIDDLADVATSLIEGFANSLTENLPEIVDLIGDMISSISETICTYLPYIIEAGYSILISIVQALTQNIGVIITAAVQIITAVVTALLNPDSITQLLSAGLELLKAIAKAIVDNLPLLIQTAITLIQTFVKDIMTPQNILALIEAAIDILLALVDGIIDNLDEILIACEMIITTIIEESLKPDNLRKLLELGGRLLTKLIEGLCQVGGKLLGFAWDLFTELGNTLASIDWAQLGIQIVEGICSGLLDCDFVLDDFLGDFGDNWVSGIRDIFGIHSPSRVMREQVGRYLAEGVGEGFEAYMPRVSRSVTDLLHAPDNGVMPSATGSVVSSSYYFNNAQTGSPKIDVHVHFSADLDGEKIAEKTAERVDILQGEAITFDERGTAH